MALRDRQTGWQGSLGWKAAFLGSSRPIRPGRAVNASYSESDPTSTSMRPGRNALLVISSATPTSRISVLTGRSNLAMAGITSLQGRRSNSPLLKVESKTAFFLKMDHE